MNTNLQKYFTNHWMAITLPILGAAALYLWQPITDYFVTRSFDENVIVQLETETLGLDDKRQLLVIHIKILNRGNVPTTIKNEDGKGEIQLEVRRIDNPVEGAWLDPESLTLIAEKSVLKQYDGGYAVAPNAFYEEVESLALPPGNYWIRATLLFEDGGFTDQVAIARVAEPTKK